MIRPSRQTTLRIAFMMAMALLVSQFAAQAHAYSHLRPGSDSTQQLDSHGRLCSECLSFAPLLSTAGSLARLPVLPPQGGSAASGVTASSLISRSRTPAFRSRAPPATL